MNLYLYLDKDTLIHKLDPRSKIFILIGSFVLTLIFQHLLYVLGIFLLILFYGQLGKSLSNLKRVGGLLLVIPLFTLLIWSLFAPGKTSLWGPVTLESLLYGTSTALKLDSMIISGLIFLSTTRNEEVVLGLIRLGVPYPVSFAFSTALRLVPTFIGTATLVAQAQRSRGLDLESGNLLARIKKYIPLLTPIFLTTLRSTNQLAMALESKGFGHKGKRTFYLKGEFQRRDIIFLSLLLLLILASIVLRFKGGGRLA